MIHELESIVSAGVPTASLPLPVVPVTPPRPARQPSGSKRSRRVRRPRRDDPGVVHLTAEYWPYARTGGLGEAVSGLAQYQAGRGVQTTVILPFYRQVRACTPSLDVLEPALPFTLGTTHHTARVYGVPRSGDSQLPRILFVDLPEFFDRSGIYGDDGGDHPDNALRFAAFCAAAVNALPRVAPDATVLHAHDWHAALAPVYTRLAATSYHQQLATVMTVHNAGFQGVFPAATLGLVGIPESLNDAAHFEWYGRINFLKGGLAFSDRAITVSPTHARELRTETGGFGLHHTFAGMAERLVGILNGIDATAWDPEQDPCIPARYSAVDLGGKAQCKSALQHGCGWRVRPERFLIALSTRLVEQKGLDLLLDADLLASTDAQFIILGSGQHHYRTALTAFAASAPDRVIGRFEFSDTAEHRLLAGADALLMPSLYEPCGLTQMRAQRYGTVPVARAVGGLRDSIADGETGLLFEDYSANALEHAVRRAWQWYQDGPAWQRLVQQAMRQPFGWRRSGDQYLALYRELAMMRA